MPIVNYSSGDTYNGDVVDNARHGQGTYTWENGSSYTGTFVADERTGEGTYNWSNGNSYTGTSVEGYRTGEGTFTWENGASYTGTFVNNARTGEGTITWSNGNSYTGTFVDDARTGQGTQIWVDEAIYIGKWVDGVQHGQGTKIWANGSSYAGAYVDGKKHGEGTSTRSDGYSYTGTYADGKKHGEGTTIYSSGDTHTGTYANNYFNGQGTYTWENGSLYTGTFVDDERTGEGTYNWSNGNSYTGTSVDGYRTGEGTFTWENGRSYTGTFVNNELTGEGTITWENGNFYTGTFVDGYRTGEGTITWTNGNSYTGAFVNGKMDGEGILTKANGDAYAGMFASDKLYAGTLTKANGDAYTGTFINGKAIGGVIAGEIPYFVGTETVEKPKTGILTTDALLYDNPKAWANNNTYDNGTSTTITYSFSGSDLNLFTDTYRVPTPGVDKIFALSAEQQAAVTLALKTFSDVADLTFVEVAETSTEVGTLRFGFTDHVWIIESLGVPAGGWASSPSSWEKAGDVWISSRFSDRTFEQGKDGAFRLLLHEIGHALGLQHPFDGSVNLPTPQDFQNYTVMSYTKPENYSYRDADGIYYSLITSTPMVYDIAAIQHLYGSSVHNAGDTVYYYDPEKPFVEAIWDSGGYDTLDLSNFKKGSTVSLIPGAYSTIVFADWSMTDNLGIAFGATIEKVMAGSGNDIIKGNSANNTLHGNAGDDTLTGGTGYDTLIGGLGADTFVYAKGDGNDIIYGFEEGVDHISYSGFTAAEEAQFEATITTEGDSFITLTDGSTLLKRTDLPEQLDLTGTLLSRGGGALSELVVSADLSNPNWQVTGTSATTGEFSLKIDSGANLNLLADMKHNNASPTEAITVHDAVEALRLSLGLNKTDGSNAAYDYMAADFNKDGKVTPQDALDIHKYALGLGDLTAGWVFVDSTGDYSAITKANVAFTEGVRVAALSASLDIAMTGILLGDVNDTYTGYLDVA